MNIRLLQIIDTKRADGSNGYVFLYKVYPNMYHAIRCAEYDQYDTEAYIRRTWYENVDD